MRRLAASRSAIVCAVTSEEGTLRVFFTWKETGSAVDKCDQFRDFFCLDLCIKQRLHEISTPFPIFVLQVGVKIPGINSLPQSQINASMLDHSVSIEKYMDFY